MRLAGNIPQVFFLLIRPIVENSKKMKWHISLLMAFLIAVIWRCPAYATPKDEELKTNGRLLACLVFSVHTIPLLNELGQAIKQNPANTEFKSALDSVGGQSRIPLARFDTEFVIETISKRISERHIIEMNENISSNPMWILANNLYTETTKNKSFNKQFHDAFNYTQSCIDEFIR